MQGDGHVVDRIVVGVGGTVSRLLPGGVAHGRVAAVSSETVLGVDELVKGYGPAIVLLLLQDLALPVAELERERLAGARRLPVDGLGRAQLHGRHLRGLGGVGSHAVLHRVALGDVLVWVTRWSAGSDETTVLSTPFSPHAAL